MEVTDFVNFIGQQFMSMSIFQCYLDINYESIQLLNSYDYNT